MYSTAQSSTTITIPFRSISFAAVPVTPHQSDIISLEGLHEGLFEYNSTKRLQAHAGVF